jgi:hypothetical protein
MPETDGPLDPEPLMQLSEMHAILVAVDQLGGALAYRADCVPQ